MSSRSRKSSRAMVASLSVGLRAQPTPWTSVPGSGREPPAPPRPVCPGRLKETSPAVPPADETRAREALTGGLADAVIPAQGRAARWIRLALRIVPVVLLVVAAWVLWREF